MHAQEKTLAVFSRLSRIVVQNHVKASTRGSYDYLGQLINNMQQINQSLTLAAIKIVKEMGEDNEGSKEQLIIKFREIIYGSVSDYAQRA